MIYIEIRIIKRIVFHIIVTFKKKYISYLKHF